jgi:hypothetical protein
MVQRRCVEDDKEGAGVLSKGCHPSFESRPATHAEEKVGECSKNTHTRGSEHTHTGVG